ncbi:malonyl-ACP O-methyltransferase BioC [Paenibacillus montanisoli]|uniref:Malonyl-[acyl-carrier protein] O-methyltransferase n=1 Tax=Paenibacillus montanisoli TaxID=2081970 RepID=A0A328U3T6_9BACL|nr:malonyl-ACP O-methyltransferase BioC [Paenibacillus montanisoli]RAP77280.1 malonyl-[acyl-carrier protein] O-methyltransferase BioC [Paenibacillus montanisoli]
MHNRFIQRNFNLSAASGSYDTHALIQRAMAEWLSETIEDRGPDQLEILEIGCGTGQFTELLIQRCPSSSILAMDMAPEMLEAAKKRLKATSDGQVPSVRFIQDDIESWIDNVPAASFDLIVSNACLQWLNNPMATLCGLKRLLRPRGRLMFTTFGDRTFRELHLSFHDAYLLQGLSPQRHTLRMQSMRQWEAWLSDCGFSDIRCNQSVQVKSYPTVRNFLHSVKAVGASASAANPPRYFLRRLFRDMYNIYEENYHLTDGIAVTYDLLRFQADSDSIN